MKKRIIIFNLILAIAFQGCRRELSCEELWSVKQKPNRTTQVPVERIYDGFNMPIGDRFEFSCIFFNKKEISNDFNFERKNEDLVCLKLLKPEKYRLRNNDTLKIYFTDPHKLIWEMSGLKLVNLIVQKEETPCDSIFNIIYKDISDKIDDIVTDQRVEVRQLYDYTLRDKIKQYIASLSRSDSIKFNNCQKSFFILDLINNVEKFGFVENEYSLTVELKDYLSTIAESIAFDVAQHNWNESRFIIKCIGYADKRNYTGDSIIKFSSLGINDSLSTHISNTNCGFVGKFVKLDESNNLKALTSVNNNCDLSILRSYSAVVYLKKRLEELTNVKFIFQYKGGGEVPDENFDINRKINLYIEEKGVSEK